MDTLTNIIIVALSTGFITHLITNYFSEKKTDKLIDRMSELSDSLNLLAMSLKEYVPQDIHRDDIKDIYSKIERVDDKLDSKSAKCDICKNYEVK